MSFLEPVRGLVWEIVAGTVVAYAVPWLSEFVQRKIPPLWERYWPVIYQTIVLPAYKFISDTIKKFFSDLLSNPADSSAVSVSESPPEGKMPLDRNTLDPPPDHVSPTITDVSKGLPSDTGDTAVTSKIICSIIRSFAALSISSNREDITEIAVSESATLIEGGTPPLDRSTLDRPPDRVLPTITDVSNGLPSDTEDTTVTSVFETHIPLDGGGMTESNLLGRASDPIVYPNSSISSNHEDITEIAVSESATLIEGGTPHIDQNVLGRALELSLDPSRNLSSDREDVTRRAAHESDTLTGGTPPLDKIILGPESEPILNTTSNISSSHEDITGTSGSDSATLAEGGISASADVDFFRDYGEGSRYRIEEVIGRGSYGVVCSAYDTHLREKVAVKKISDIFKHVSDATRILREIKLLRLLRHPDIMDIKHILLPPSRRDFRDMYIVFELTECDLRNTIKVNDGLTPEHCRFFLYQLLRGLKYIHTANVFHRDLNPKNILTIADCKIKIRHFSHAFIDTPTAIFWTDYVATRWYKAPELCGQFFFSSKYSPAIDIWSIGCIFAELLTGKPLFPGKNSFHQLDLITDLLGTPSAESISKIKNEKALTSLSSMRKKRPIPFPQKFPNVDPLALVLLKRMLAFDPEDRPSAEEALADPYFKELARLETEPSAQPVTEADFEFERLNVTKEDVRELIYREILEYHPKLLKKEHIEVAEPNANCSSNSFSRRRRMLAKMSSIAPIKLLHHPQPS